MYTFETGLHTSPCITVIHNFPKYKYCLKLQIKRKQNVPTWSSSSFRSSEFFSSVSLARTSVLQASLAVSDISDTGWKRDTIVKYKTLELENIEPWERNHSNSLYLQHTILGSKISIFQYLPDLITMWSSSYKPAHSWVVKQTNQQEAHKLNQLNHHKMVFFSLYCTQMSWLCGK